MIIRTLHETDSLDNLVALSRAFFNEYEAHHEDFFKLDELNDQNIEAYFSSFVNHEDRAAYIALEGYRIVGYVTIRLLTQAPFWKVKRIGHISGLMVEHGYRRQGIAGQLLAEARRFFNEQRVEYFTVSTAVENQSGVEFYKAHGMKPLNTLFLGRVESED